MSDFKRRISALEAMPVENENLITGFRMIRDGDEELHDLEMIADGYTKKALPGDCFTLWQRQP
ncbi:MAG: hypothetical protein RI893_1065 [Pseudomonadota bacterium]|jgi:hypothetical protein